MKRCVIIGGGPIERYDIIRTYLAEDDYCIFCDCGLKHMEALGVRPDLIVGDFDSFDRDEYTQACNDFDKTEDIEQEPEQAEDKSERIVTFSGEVIELCPVKDDTDTGHAVTVAVERGFTEFLLLGMTGRRIDHSLGNIYLLHRLDELDLKAMIVDDYSEISIVNRETVYIDDRLPFFSLINITGKAAGIDIDGAKYPLRNAEILQTANDLGISNEVPKGNTARITVREGKLLLVRDFVG